MRMLTKVGALTAALLVGAVIQASAEEHYSCAGSAAAPLLPLASHASEGQTQSQSLSDLIEQYTADYIGRSLTGTDKPTLSSAG
jgi:hypothetical protein